MADGPNISGMVNDPSFQGLPPAQQRAALTGLTKDDSFSRLSDADTLRFVSGFKQQAQPSFMDRLNNRMESNAQGLMDLPGNLYNATKAAIHSPHSLSNIIPNIKAGVSGALPKDIPSGMADLISMFIGGKAMGGEAPAVAPEETAVAPRPPVPQAAAANAADQMMTATAPYQVGPGQIPAQMIRPRAFTARTAEPIPARQGLMLPGQVEAPSGFPRPADAPPSNPALAEPPRTNIGGPRVLNPESVTRQILDGFDNQTLIKIAKSRGINVSAESQLKPTVGNNRIIGKIVDDMKPEELKEIHDRYIENTRQPLPSGIGPEAYRTAALQTYFPDLKVSNARVGRMSKALASTHQVP